MPSKIFHLSKLGEDSPKTESYNENMTHEISFCYSNPHLKRTYLVNKDEKVLSAVNILALWFFQESVLKNFEFSNFELSIVPKVRNESVTVEQLTRLNGGAKPVVLVSHKNSHMTADLIQARQDLHAREVMDTGHSGRVLPDVPSELHKIPAWLNEARKIMEIWKHELDIKNVEISEWKKELNQKNMELKRKNVEIAQWKKELDQKNMELERKNMELERKNVEIAQWRKELDQKNVELEQKNVEIAQWKKEIDEENKEMKDWMLKTDLQIKEWKQKENQKNKLLAPIYIGSALEKYLIIYLELDKKTHFHDMNIGGFLKYASQEQRDELDNVLKEKKSVITVENLMSYKSIWDERKRNSVSRDPPFFKEEVTRSMSILGIQGDEGLEQIVNILYNEKGFLEAQYFSCEYDSY